MKMLYEKDTNINLIKSVTDEINIPVIASGGMGHLRDIDNVVVAGGADAVAIAHALHYRSYTVSDIREYCIGRGIPVRITPNESQVVA